MQSSITKNKDINDTIMNTYAGIGSRKTPKYILELMSKIATKLEKKGYTLNSGGADGADIAFANGCTKKNVFIPWKGFNGIFNGICSIPEEAFTKASNIHPAWDKCSSGAKKLHARNVQQILGKDLKTPVKFVICWTPNAKLKGGTATAIKLALANNIEVYNLADSNTLSMFIDV